MTTFGMPSLLRGRSEGLGEDADPTEYAKVCVFGMGKRWSPARRILTDADWVLRTRLGVVLGRAPVHGPRGHIHRYLSSAPDRSERASGRADYWVYPTVRRRAVDALPGRDPHRGS